jgi:hypothetical protein
VKEKEKSIMEVEKCKECGKPDKACYAEPTKTHMLDRSLCFNCNFWTELMAEKEKHLFINGESYLVGDEDSKDYFRGCAGREFNIKTKDGKTIKTTNLWVQGKIPDHFKDRLQNNAEWIR